MSFTARPEFDIGTDLFPSSEIEIADAEIRAGRQFYRLAKRGEQLLLDIVEDSRQGVGLFWLAKLPSVYAIWRRDGKAFGEVLGEVRS